MKTVLLFVGLSASSVLTAQVNPPDSDANQSTPAPQPVPPYQRPVSLERIIPNIVDDQSKIWLFPAKLNKKRNWIPVAVILGTTAALIALDSQSRGPPEPASGDLAESTGVGAPRSGGSPGISGQADSG